MAKIGRKLRQGRENEPAFAHAWVRDTQIRRVHDKRPEKQNVYIDGARALPALSRAAHLALDLLGAVQQLPRKKVRFHLRDQVQESRLGGNCAMRLGFPCGRDAHNAHTSGLQAAESVLEMLFTIAEIRSER
jgi:hypothetical protein